ncbi:MAG: NFACT family protein [Candidatus Micrarchaeia archaeon]
MRDISSIEINLIVKELSPFIQGSRIRKIYFLGGDSFRITFYKDNDTLHLYIKLLKTINKTNFSESGDEPNNFVMGLRKRIENRIVNSIEQKNSDRICIIDIGKEHFLFVIEMLGKGNIILVDENNKIELSYKALEFSDRIIKKGNEYKLPKNDSLSFEEAIKNLSIILEKSGSEKIISILSKNFNIGPLYIEDILKRADVDPKKIKITESEKEAIEKEIIKFSKVIEEPKPTLYLENNVPLNYAICEIKKYENLEKKIFNTLNELLDYLYLSDRSYIKDNKKQQMLEELKANIEKQDVLYKKLTEDSKRYSKIGNTIFERLNILNDAIFYMRENKKTTLEELKKRFPELNIKKLDLKDKKFIIEIDE